MPGLTDQDVGACNCPSACGVCLPCALPSADLTLTFNNNGTIVTVPLVYTAPCTWDTGCFTDLVFWRITIICNTGTGRTQYNNYQSNASCATLVLTRAYDTTTGPGGLTLDSAVCAPLSLAFHFTATPTITFTIS